MTKKETTILKVIALLTIMLLGALAVYPLIPFSSANNLGTNKESLPKKVPEEKEPKISEKNIQISLKKNQETPLSEHTVPISSSQDSIEHILPGKLTFVLVFLGLLVCHIYYNVQVANAIATEVRLDRDEIESKQIKAPLNIKWATLILCLFILGWLCDTFLKSYVAQSKYVRIVIEAAVVVLFSIAIIVLLFRKALEVQKKYPKQS